MKEWHVMVDYGQVEFRVKAETEDEAKTEALNIATAELHTILENGRDEKLKFQALYADEVDA